MTRKRQGLFPLPLRFFTKLREHVLDPGHGFLTLVRLGSEAIAGAVFLHFNGQAVYAHGASNKRYSRLRSNNLLMWDAIQSFAGQGAKTFSMGITDAANTGLRRFKCGITGNEQELHYYKYDYRTGGYETASESTLRTLSIACSNRLPPVLLRAIGNALYPHHG